MNQRKMAQAMKRMGIAQQEIHATEVIIKTVDKELVFKDPQVSKVNMMGQVTFQVVGHFVEQSLEPDISDEDIDMIMEQVSMDKDTVREALLNNNGDIAKTILELKKE